MSLTDAEIDNELPRLINHPEASTCPACVVARRNSLVEEKFADFKADGDGVRFLPGLGLRVVGGAAPPGIDNEVGVISASTRMGVAIDTRKSGGHNEEEVLPDGDLLYYGFRSGLSIVQIHTNFHLSVASGHC